MWCVPSITADYLRAMEEVLEVYERPYDTKEPVICLDEKCLQLLDDKAAPRAMRRGVPMRRDAEYIRRGTANIFCAIEPKAGRHFERVTPNRKAETFATMLASLSRRYRNVRTIHLVMDNLNTHVEGSLIKRYGPQEGRSIWQRFTVHYTPVHGSWLNQAEMEIRLLSRQCLGKRRFGDLVTLREEVNAWNAAVNAKQVKIGWTFDRAKARATFRYRPKKLT